MQKQEIKNLVDQKKKTVQLSDLENYKVFNDYCIVAPVVFKGDDSGVITPTQYEDKNEYGVVLASGPGRRADYANLVHDPDLRVGDVVLYGQYSYTQVRIDSVDLNIIRHDDIIAVLPQ